MFLLMKKSIIIIILIVVNIVSIISIHQSSSRATYWMSRTLAAEEVLDEMINHDEDYFLDVVMERDCYSLWYSLGGNQ